MSQYQRMVSYLYRYEDDVKKNNTGYARIERRGDTCRITVQLRDSLSELPEVAFFRQEQQGVQLIIAGRLKKNGNDFGCRIETRVDNIMNTGNVFSDMDGLMIFVRDSLYYATTWKDVTVHFGHGGIEDRRREMEREEQQDIREEQDSSAREESTEWSAAGTELEKANDGWNLNDMEKRPEETGQEPDNMERKPEEVVQEPDNMVGKPEEVVQEPDDMVVRQEIPPAGQASASVGDADAIAACQCEACRQCPQRRRAMDFGHHILSMFPRMYPFEVENMKECVRLELKDIGCLPVPYWSLAGNPFLLHGYYCYRHILFTGSSDGKYYIGVPGIYNRDNEGQAKSCGFVRFEPLSKVADLQGAFGYWLFSVSE